MAAHALPDARLHRPHVGVRKPAALPDRFHAQALARQPLQPDASEDASPRELPRLHEQVQPHGSPDAVLPSQMWLLACETWLLICVELPRICERRPLICERLLRAQHPYAAWPSGSASR